MKYKCFLPILFFLFCHVSNAFGYTQMSFANRWPFSPAKSIATSDNYVFQALGNVIIVIDKADFSNATPVSRIYLDVSEGITNLRYEAPYLFVTTGHHGLSKITISSATISDPPIVIKEPIPAWTQSEIDAGITESGTARDVAISGNRAYVAYTKLNQEEQLYQTGIQVVEASSPSTLTLLDAVIVTNDAIASGLASGLTESRRIAISGGYAYIVDTAQGIHVFDISKDTPEFLTIAGFLPTFDISAPGDGYAYTACTAGGIQILDIATDPAKPEIMTVFPIENEDGTTDEVTYFQYNDSTTHARSLQAAGGVTYVADGYSGLITLDTSDPADPRKLGTYGTNLINSYSVHLDTDSTVYIADYQSGLTKINASAPASPTLIDSIHHSAARTDRFFVNLEGDVFYAYIVDASASHEGLRILKLEKVSDIYGDLVTNSEFRNVRFQSFLATDGQAQDIDVRHYAVSSSTTYSYAFVADGSNGVQIIDVTSKTNPSNTGLAADAAINDARAVELDSSGSFAFVADGDNGLRILQILDASEVYPISNPLLLDTVAPPSGGTAKDVLFTSAGSAPDIDYYVYVAAGSAGLQIVQYNPEEKTGTVVDSYDTDGDTKSVEVFDKYAFLADGSNGVVILDISDFQNQEDSPKATFVGSIDTPGDATKLWIQQVASGVVYAYVADGDKGIRAIDVSNPYAPAEFDPAVTYDTPGYASDIAVNQTNDMIIVGDGSGGFSLVSISDPETTETPDYSYTESPDISSGCFIQSSGL